MCLFLLNDLKRILFGLIFPPAQVLDLPYILRDDRVAECFFDGPFLPNLREAVLKSMRFYGEEHENFSCIHHTDFRINRYGIDGFMSSHVDNIHHSHGQQYGYPQVSVLLFLNDDYEGGEIIVADNEYNHTAGSVLIFPSNFMFPHEVKSVTKGERWSVVAWLM